LTKMSNFVTVFFVQLFFSPINIFGVTPNVVNRIQAPGVPGNLARSHFHPWSDRCAVFCNLAESI
jgi:hypothetical protein